MLTKKIVTKTLIAAQSKIMAKHGIQAIFGQRFGGKSKPPFDQLNTGFHLGDDPLLVAKNVQILCHATALPAPHRAQQVHGITRQWYTGAGHNHDHHADALLTAEAGCAVAIQTADCVPVLLAHPATGVVAAIHAGWRGTAKNIVSHVCDALQERGIFSCDIIASIGPAIGKCCFSVSQETFQMLAQSIAQRIDPSLPLHANLTYINQQQLIAKGVPATAIEIMSPCTSCHPERFFSYRRDGATTGRQLSIIRSPVTLLA